MMKTKLYPTWKENKHIQSPGVLLWRDTDDWRATTVSVKHWQCIKISRKIMSFKTIPQKSRGEMLKMAILCWKREEKLLQCLVPCYSSTTPPFPNQQRQQAHQSTPLPTGRKWDQLINIINRSGVRRDCGLLPLKWLETLFYTHACWFYFTSIKLPLIRFSLRLTLNCTILTFKRRSFLWLSTFPVSLCPS